MQRRDAHITGSFQSRLAREACLTALVGYRPIEFLRVVEREGALTTARRLIMRSAPSSGFTRLWELKRLDLTVEALALRQPWRRLFTEAELGQARQRLD